MVIPRTLTRSQAGAQADAAGRGIGWEPTRLAARADQIPDYLEKFYWWAYARPFAIAVFDHDFMVSMILWGQYGKLKTATLEVFQGARHALQAACVYGGISAVLAKSMSGGGRLDIVDIVPIQVANCRAKLAGFANTVVRVADATAPGGGSYDRVLSFFLLHEVPDDTKRGVVNSLLDSLEPGGKAIFVEYHRPLWFHPLKFPTWLIFKVLEPFAVILWDREIASFADRPGDFTWRKKTHFGRLFQIVTAERSKVNAGSA